VDGAAGAGGGLLFSYGAAVSGIPGRIGGFGSLQKNKRHVLGVLVLPVCSPAVVWQQWRQFLPFLVILSVVPACCPAVVGVEAAIAFALISSCACYSVLAVLVSCFGLHYMAPCALRLPAVVRQLWQQLVLGS
jgi:hypothetical protein